MLDLSIDVKCSVTTAILSVLVYLLLVNLLSRSSTSSVGQSMDNSSEWYKSMEFVMLVSVFLAFNFNNYLFNSCKSA
jgi:hypothetical protein